MTARACDNEGLLSSCRIARCRARVCGNRDPGKACGLAPFAHHALADRGDLLVGEHATGTLCKRWHEGAFGPLGYRSGDVTFAGDGKVCGVIEGQRSAVAAALSMTAGAVLFVESMEVKYVFWAFDIDACFGMAGRVASKTREGQGKERYRARPVKRRHHGCTSLFASGSSGCGSSARCPKSL